MTLALAVAAAGGVGRALAAAAAALCDTRLLEDEQPELVLSGVDAVVAVGAPSPRLVQAAGEADVTHRVVVREVGFDAAPLPSGWFALECGLILTRRLAGEGLGRLAAVLHRKYGAELVPVVHADDVGRALVARLQERDTRPHGMVTAGAVPVSAIRQALGLPRRRARRGSRHVLGHDEQVDSFPCQWSAVEAVDDVALAAAGRSVLPRKVRRRPGRALLHVDLLSADQPAEDDHELAWVLTEDVRGELDGPIDSRFAAYSSVNLSEALPGPATPLSLTTVGAGTSAAGLAFVDLVPLRHGVVRTEFYARSQVIVAHRPYVNLGCIVATVRLVPGIDEANMKEQFIGRSSGSIALFGEEEVPDVQPGIFERIRLAVGFGRHVAGLLRHYRREAAAYQAAASALLGAAASSADLSDDRLLDLIDRAKDLIVVGWVIGGRNVMAVQIWTTLAGSLGVRDAAQVSAGEASLASAASLDGVRHLAGLAREDPAAHAVLLSDANPLEEPVRAASPTFGRALDDALAAFGHRGPGECELANSPYRDRPERLLRAVAHEVSVPVRDATRSAAGSGRVRGPGRAALRMASSTQQLREDVRDDLVRVTDALRRLAAVRGSRLAEREVLPAADDVWYLTYDELRRPPAECAHRVKIRKAERERLAGLSVPMLLAVPWTPSSEEPRVVAGDELTGAGASPGIAKGVVRIVTADNVDDLEPGEVLVANVTDVGYTAAFSYAAAVVTDVGGVMSHAAIVAREFGVPSVVDTKSASIRLRDGMVVEVDGKRGTVRVVAEVAS